MNEEKTSSTTYTREQELQTDLEDMAEEKERQYSRAEAAEARVKVLEEKLEQGADLVDVSVDEGTLPKNATLIAWSAAIRAALEGKQ